MPFEDFEIHTVIHFGKYSGFVLLFLYNKSKSLAVRNFSLASR